MTLRDTLSGRFGAALVALLALSVLVTGIGAAVALETVTIDDPEQEEIETTIEFSGADDATAEIDVIDDTDTVVDTETVEYVAADHDDDAYTETVAQTVEESGDYDVDVTVTDGPDSAVDSTTIEVVELPHTIEDGDDLIVDLEFEGADDATAEIDVIDAETDDVVETETLEYVAADYDDNETMLTAEFDELDAGDYEVVVTITEGDETALVDEHVSISGSSGAGVVSDASGWIDDASPTELVIVFAIGILGAVYAGREGWI